MPTIIKVKGYRLFFVSFDGSEPIHVHVRRGDFSAKVWWTPCGSLGRSSRITRSRDTPNRRGSYSGEMA